MNPLPVVLVVDDEVRSQEALRRALEDEATVYTCGSALEARGVMEREPVDVILCDQRMPGTTGVEFLRTARERWPHAVRIVISAYTDIDDIIAGINEAGIWQYLVKPWHPDTIALTVRNAAEMARLQRENDRLALELRTAAPQLRSRVESRRKAVREAFDFDRIVRAPGSPLEPVVATARRIAPHDLPVLITGESGTGKELFARAIHYASDRAGRAFVVENCAALPDTLLESELFGVKRGAYTGAVEDREGLLAQADGGTVFLDEIGDTSPAFQVKLLRALQDGELRPVGASRSMHVDVRVIAATHRDLEADLRAGRFREDLYYRLAGVTLHVPALRDRPGDILAIAERCLALGCASLHRPAACLAPETIDALAAHDWPGNVRELQNEVQRMLAMSDGDVLTPDLLSPRVAAASHSEQDAGAGLEGNLRERLESLEAELLRAALARHGGNKTRAAAELGLSRVGLRAKLVRYGVEPDAAAPDPSGKRRRPGKPELFAVK
jgi:two-component system response regulator HupR/HoxA